jgi:type III secretion protein Q
MLIEECLPALPERWSKPINTWLARRTALKVMSAGAELRLAWLERDSAPALMHLHFKRYSYRWTCSLASLAALDARLAGAPFSAMPEALRSIVIQKLLSDLMRGLPAEVVQGMEGADIEWGAGAPLEGGMSFPFELLNQAQGTVSTGQLVVATPETLEWLAQHLPFSEQQRAAFADGLPLQARLEIGGARLSVSELAGLSAGDLIWIERAGLDKQGIHLFLQLQGEDHQAIFKACWKHKALSIVARAAQEEMPVREFAGSFSENPAMRIDPSQLELPVSFDLGEIAVPFAELTHIGPGHVFQLAHEAADATVTVRIHGKQIAEGKLMVVGRRLAVRVTKIRQADNAIQMQSDMEIGAATAVLIE